MANTNAPFGFRDFQGNIGGASPNAAQIVRQIAYNDTTKIFNGDPVKSLSTGYVAQWTASTAVSQLAGIFVGCSYLSVAYGNTRWSRYWPGADVASGSIVSAYLVPCNLAAPGLFMVQSSGTAFSIADIGANADVTIGTGSTATGQSGASLDQATLAGTATLPFRIVGLYSDYGPPGSSGTEAASYNWAIVAANVAGAGSTGI